MVGIWSFCMNFPMDVLASKVPTNNWLLFGAGMVMVVTLWFSNKAKDVVKTSLDLSNQGETKERFQPNALSRGFVRFAMGASKVTAFILPISWQEKIEQQFEQPVIKLTKNKVHELPAFDLVRAAVNLMVAAVLISIATSYKLPLSTTYVTLWWRWELPWRTELGEQKVLYIVLQECLMLLVDGSLQPLVLLVLLPWWLTY